MNAFILWHKFVCFAFSNVKKTYTYAILHEKVVPSATLFEEPFYKQQLFINLYIDVKTFDLRNKIQDKSEVIHSYFMN